MRHFQLPFELPFHLPQSFPLPSPTTLNIFAYTVGSYAAMQALRSLSIAKHRFYLEHLHTPPRTRLQEFHFHQRKLWFSISAAIASAVRNAIRVSIPLSVALGIEWMLGEALNRHVTSYKEQWNWLHLHSILAGTLTGWIFWSRFGKAPYSMNNATILPGAYKNNLKRKSTYFANKDGLLYGTLIGTTLCLSRLYRE